MSEKTKFGKNLVVVLRHLDNIDLFISEVSLTGYGHYHSSPVCGITLFPD